MKINRVTGYAQKVSRSIESDLVITLIIDFLLAVNLYKKTNKPESNW